METRIAEARRLEDERIRKRKLAEELRRKQMEQSKERERQKDQIIIANLDEDDQLLEKTGDELYSRQGDRKFVDDEFSERIAKGADEENEIETNLHFGSISEIKSQAGQEVFTDGISAADVR